MGGRRIKASLVCAIAALLALATGPVSAFEDAPPVAAPESAVPSVPADPATAVASSEAAAADAPVEIAAAVTLETGRLRESLPRIATVDLTAEPQDMWERIRNGFSMPNLDGELVARHQAWFLSRPQYLVRVMERSRRYLFHIVEEIEKRGLPTELALLPIVESSYDPMALSPARASGLWQFIPSTGRNYQLEQNWWVDERRDIVASTSAALDYLRDIYQMHGDWHLALASYNWGENAVARAIERNKAKGVQTDYSSLTMPAETRNYVPKLQALKNIIARPHLFGLSLDPIPNRPYFATVQAPREIDISVAARLAETPAEEIRALNPGHNRPVVLGRKEILLPVEKVDTFLSNLEEHNRPLSAWRTYTLRSPERVEQVARRFGISVAALKEANGLGRKTTRLPAGASLLVPARDTVSGTSGGGTKRSQAKSGKHPGKATSLAAAKRSRTGPLIAKGTAPRKSKASKVTASRDSGKPVRASETLRVVAAR